MKVHIELQDGRVFDYSNVMSVDLDTYGIYLEVDLHDGKFEAYAHLFVSKVVVTK